MILPFFDEQINWRKRLTAQRLMNLVLASAKDACLHCCLGRQGSEKPEVCKKCVVGRLEKNSLMGVLEMVCRAQNYHG
jgi:hypothetical protein